MKKIFKTVALIAAASVALLACNKEAPSKAEVEKGFTPFKASTPTVSIDVDNYTFDNVKGIASVSLTISGVSADCDSLSVGFLTTTDSTLKTTKFFPVEGVAADGTFTIDTVSVITGKRNYIVAAASTLAGTSLSEVLVLDIPDIEWYKKLPITGEGTKSYYAHLADYWGDEYDSTIKVSYNPTTHEVRFDDFEPYNLSKKRSTYTIGIADIDDVENPTVNFAVDATAGTFFFDSPVAGLIDYYGFIAVPFIENEEGDDVENTDSYKITFNKDMTEMTVQAWGMYSTAAGGYYEIFFTTLYQAL